MLMVRYMSLAISSCIDLVYNCISESHAVMNFWGPRSC